MFCATGLRIDCSLWHLQLQKDQGAIVINAATTRHSSSEDRHSAHRQPSQGQRSGAADLARRQRDAALRVGRDARRQRRRRLRRVPGAGVDPAVSAGALPGRAAGPRWTGTAGGAAQGKVLSAVYRVGPYKTSTGTPSGYALRLLVEKTQGAARRERHPLAVAN